MHVLGTTSTRKPPREPGTLYMLPDRHMVSALTDLVGPFGLPPIQSLQSVTASLLDVIFCAT